MPDPNQDFIDAVNGTAPATTGADPNQDFIDAVGQGASQQPSTPETDAALNETFPEQMHRVFGAISQSMPAWMRQRASAANAAAASKYLEWLKKPSPSWLQPF